MAITAVGSGIDRHTLAYCLDQRLEIFERAAREDAVAEIEDVTRPATRLPQDAPRPGHDALDRAEQYPGIQVALNSAAEPDSLPACVKVDAPVEGDDIGAAGRDQLEQPRGGGAEVNRRHVERTRRLEDPPRERQHARFVVGR